MAEGEKKDRVRKISFWPHGVFMILILGVILLSILALLQPPSEGIVFPTPTVITQTPDPGQVENGTPTPELLPPSPEEVGSTSGIIVWGTLLVLIFLIGTLRETLYRKGNGRSSEKNGGENHG
jgi:membrane protease YdiL (CAAX protease family)